MRVRDKPYPDRSAVMIVERSGMSIEVVEIVTTLPNRIPISQER
jgi:hypothetical protein